MASDRVDPTAVDALLVQAERPPIGQVVRDTERYLVQALGVLEREFDEASLGGVDPSEVAAALRSAAGFVGFAQNVLVTLAEGGRPAPVGSAVRVPGGRQTTDETDGPRTAGTDGALNTEIELEMTR